MFKSVRLQTQLKNYHHVIVNHSASHPSDSMSFESFQRSIKTADHKMAFFKNKSLVKRSGLWRKFGCGRITGTKTFDFSLIMMLTVFLSGLSVLYRTPKNLQNNLIARLDPKWIQRKSVKFGNFNTLTAKYWLNLILLIQTNLMPTGWRVKC